METSIRSAWLFTVAWALVAMTACDKSDGQQAVDTTQPVSTATTPITSPDPVETERPKVDTSVLLTPRTVYTGFDGSHAFSFPIALDGPTDNTAMIDVSDHTALELKAAKLAGNDGSDTSRYYLVTVKKAGDYTINVSWGGKTASSTVHVTTYTPQRYTAGQARYTNGNGTATNQRACTTCHNDMQGAPDHSPASLAGVDDARVKQTITQGILADGTLIYDFFGVDHKWQANEAELDGLVTYLRALPQKKVVPQ